MEAAAERPPIDGPVTVLIPVRDFAKGLSPFLSAWRGQLTRMNRLVQFVLIDAGSSDDTRVVAEQLAATESDVRRVETDSKRGLGAAIQAGLSLSTEPLVMILVPHHSFRPSDLPLLFAALKIADVVVAVRPGAPASRPHRWFQRIGEVTARIIFGIEPGPPRVRYAPDVEKRKRRYRWIYGLRAQDPESGWLLMRREVLERCPIQSNGSFALVELLAKANFAGAFIAEVAVSKPGDLPVMREQFESVAGDEKRVFRRPKFGQLTRPELKAEPAAPTTEEVSTAP